MIQIDGEKIKQIRESRDLSQSELADKIGVTRQAIDLWERGGVKTFKTLERVAAALGVLPELLLMKKKTD